MMKHFTPSRLLAILLAGLLAACTLTQQDGTRAQSQPRSDQAAPAGAAETEARPTAQTTPPAPAAPSALGKAAPELTEKTAASASTSDAPRMKETKREAAAQVSADRMSIALMPQPAAHPIAPMPQEGRERYSQLTDNTVMQVAAAPVSTFSIDVDTGSYSNVRRMLNAGRLPPADAVRVEELINYFPYDYAPPKGDRPFAVHTEMAPAPWWGGAR